MKSETYKFDIIVVAGQSNAEGNGIATTLEKYHNDNVFQLTENSLTVYGYGLINYEKSDDFTVDFADYRKSSFRCTLDFSETFAESYIKNGFLKQNRKILIVKAAVGGTGFSLGQWGVGNPLHERMKDMIDSALALNPENKLVSFLWHQGEHDSFEQPELTPAAREEFYYNAFKQTANDIRNRYNVPNLPIIAGEMVNDWADKFKEATSAVENATKRVCGNIGHADVASSEGLSSNAQAVNWSADDIHFSAVALKELGKRYFDKYSEIINAE